MKKKSIGILINDVHLDKNNGILIKEIFRQLIEKCLEYDTYSIFCGGDVFTNRSGQPLQCLTDWKDILGMLRFSGITMYVIPGNHDKTDGDDERSYLDVFDTDDMENDSYVLFRKASYVLIDNSVVAFIPYFKDEKWLEQYNDMMSEKKALSRYVEECDASFLITHSGFDGVRNNDGSKVTSIIKPSMFKDWSGVLIGHYHDASSLADNVHYTGSAYQNNYGENITDKGFTVLFSDGTIKFEPSQFPKYIKEKVEATDKESLMNLIEKYEGEEENFIRLIISGKKTDCQNINVTEIKNKGIDVQFVIEESVEAMELSESDSVLSFDKKAIMKDFFKFCSENGIKGDKMKFGLNLIKQIGNVESN